MEEKENIVKTELGADLDPNGEAEIVSKGKVEKKGGKRIGYNYIILKSLKESRKNDVMKCLYIKSLTRFGVCVIKEGSSGDTMDKYGRDIKSRLLWQKELHAMLESKLRIPKLLGSFEENGNFYLVIERIKGKSLMQLCKKDAQTVRAGLITGNKLGQKVLGHLAQMADLVSILHSQQIIHRDITSSNFMIMPNGKVAMIDMELSYSLLKKYPDPPFQLGTHGYMSPEQEITEIPTPQQDIFSLGAIMLSVWTGISPTKLTTSINIEEIQRKVSFFVPDRALADIISKCLERVPQNRPNATLIKNALINASNDFRNKTIRSVTNPQLFTKEEISITIKKSLNALGSVLMADPEKGWFSENMLPEVNQEKGKINRAWYSSFNRGSSGIIYMLSKAKSVGYDVDTISGNLIKVSIDLIRKKYIQNAKRTSSGLHFGSDGIAACLATAINHQLLDANTELLEWIPFLLGRKCERRGLIDGIAGQGIANLLCRSFLPPNLLEQRLQEITNELLLTQEKDGSWTHQVIKSKKRTIPGLGYGISGIILFLLEYGNQYKQDAAIAAAEKGLQWLIIKSIKKGKENVEWRSFTGKELSNSWVDGSPGIGLAFLKGLSITGKEIYREYAERSLRRIPINLVHSNISQSIGLSGLGEIYLEANNILGGSEWINRAATLVQVIIHMKIENSSHGSYWLVENEKQPVGNFMIGNAGILHFLLRYLHPAQIGFPLGF